MWKVACLLALAVAVVSSQQLPVAQPDNPPQQAPVVPDPAQGPSDPPQQAPVVPDPAQGPSDPPQQAPVVPDPAQGPIDPPQQAPVVPDPAQGPINPPQQVPPQQGGGFFQPIHDVFRAGADLGNAWLKALTSQFRAFTGGIQGR